jgi:putative membrane protein
MRTRFALLSTTALLLAAPAFAQQPAAQQSLPQSSPQAAAPNAAGQLGKPDMRFMKEAAMGGLAEVELGKLAQQNAQDDQVKQFGAKMDQDHGKANNELQQIAGAKGITLPQQLDKKGQAMLNKLSRLHGAAFDRAYMRAEVKDHNKDVKEFGHAAQTARDPEVKQFAANTLQVIEQHDKLAKEIDRSLSATGSSPPARR